MLWPASETAVEIVNSVACGHFTHATLINYDDNPLSTAVVCLLERTAFEKKKG